MVGKARQREGILVRRADNMFEEFPDAHDTCMLPPAQSSCHLGQWCLVAVVSISTGIHGDDPACDSFHQRGHLPQRSVAMPRGQRPWDLSRLVAFAPALIMCSGRVVPYPDRTAFFGITSGWPILRQLAEDMDRSERVNDSALYPTGEN
jgi:hypothetical protein